MRSAASATATPNQHHHGYVYSNYQPTTQTDRAYTQHAQRQSRQRHVNRQDGETETTTTTAAVSSPLSDRQQGQHTPVYTYTQHTAHALTSNPREERHVPRVTPSPPCTANVSVAIRDRKATGTDINVHINVHHLNDNATSTASIVPSKRASTAAPRSVLSASLLGGGRWSLYSQLILVGVLMTLAVSLITVPLLLMHVDRNSGGTDMQIQHIQQEEQEASLQRVITITTSIRQEKEGSVLDHLDVANEQEDQEPAEDAIQADLEEAVISPQRQEQTISTPTTEQTPDAEQEQANEGQEDQHQQPEQLSDDQFLLPFITPSSLSVVAEYLTLFTVFSPTYVHIPSTLPLHSWTLLFSNSSNNILVFVPDDVTCRYLLLDQSLPVNCVVVSQCFDDRNRKRRRKVNRGQYVWEWDREARRQAKLICIIKEVERQKRTHTPFLGYFDPEAIVTADLILAMDRIVRQMTNQKPADEQLQPAAITPSSIDIIQQTPFMMIGRSWDININNTRMPDHRDKEALSQWVQQLRAASLVQHYLYVQSFPSSADVEFFSHHNTYALHWFVYVRGSLPLHAVTKTTYISDENEDEEQHHSHSVSADSVSETGDDDDSDGSFSDPSVGWHMLGAGGDLPESHGFESFVVWAAKTRSRPAISIIDVSDSCHVMRCHQHSEHDHSIHPFPPSLAVIPQNASEAEIQRLTSNVSDYHPSNPVSVPLSPASAHYKLIGDCSEDCHLLADTETEITTRSLLESNTNEAGQIILLSVNKEYLPMAYNWVCRANALNLHSYLFIAEDRLSYAALLSRRIPVLLVNYARTRKPTAFTETNSSWLFDETLHSRSTVLAYAVNRMNLSVMLLHLDVVLFDDPLSLVAANDHKCDVLVPLNDSNPSGGIFYYPVTDLSHLLISHLSDCERENVAFAHVYGGNRFVFSDDKEGSCLMQQILRFRTRYRFRCCSFDPMLFASEHEFFQLQLPQHKGFWPITAHIQQQKSVTAKIKVMKEWKLWMYDEDRDLPDQVITDERRMLVEARRRTGQTETNIQLVECLAEESSSTARSSVSLIIELHLLADAGDVDALQLTLSSLDRTSASFPVHLYLDVAATEAEEQQQHVKRLQQRSWKHGELHLRLLSQPMQPNAEWTLSWINTSDLEQEKTDPYSPLLLIIKAGQQVSEQLFAVLSSFLQSCSLSLPDDLFSLSLLHHLDIIGETPENRYGSRTTMTQLDAQTQVFGYQLSSLTGSLFTKHSLSNFLIWYRQHVPSAAESLPSTYPCVPSLVSNSWYLSHPDKFFDQWLHRYNFERGSHSIHFNFAGDTRGQLADTQSLCGTDKMQAVMPECFTPIALINDSSKDNSRVSLLSSSVSFAESLDLSSLRLYDFHFSPVVSPRSILARRSSMFAPHNHWDKTEGRMIDDPQVQQDIEDAVNKQTTVIYEEEEEQEGQPLNTTALEGGVAAGTAAVDDPIPVVKPRVLFGEDQLKQQKFLRLLLTAEMNTIKRSVPAANNPLNLTYPDSLQDRCFVLGSRDDVQRDQEDEELRINPYVPPSTHRAYITLAAYHKHLMDMHTARLISTDKQLHRQARVLLYQPQIKGSNAGIPFDRMLRGLYFSFLLSLCLERMLVIDVPYLHKLYQSPVQPDGTWLYAIHRTHIERLIETAIPKPTEQQLTLNHASLMRTANLSAVFTTPLLVYRELISMDRALMENKYYRWMTLTLFNSVSRTDRTAQVMHYLLSIPQPSLSQQAAALQYHLALNSPLYKVIALRVDFHDEAAYPSADDPFPGVSPAFFSCVFSMLSVHSGRTNNTILFYTSNRPTKVSYEYIQQRFSVWGKVLTYTDKMEKLKARMSAGLGGAAITHEAEHLIGYVLSEIPTIIISDTTYGIFLSSRGSWSNQTTMLIVQNEKKNGVEYCGPIARKDLDKRIDIIY